MLLLDEPFSNLDAKLRERAREWLKQLQHNLGLTTIFVTHDQDEAMALSDRIVVMDGGSVLRTGTPEEIYRSPGDRRVAEFVGVCNFLPATISRSTGTTRLILVGFPLGIELDDATGLRDGDPVTAAVRPEDLALSDDPRDGPIVSVLDSSYLGDHYQTRVTLRGLDLIVNTDRRPAANTMHLHLRQGAIALVT